MKCCNCKNLGKLIDENGVPYDWCEKVCDNPDTHMERKCRHYAVASNSDRIRQMSDEELAEWVTTKGRTFGEEYEGYMSLLDWLKSPVEVDNGT